MAEVRANGGQLHMETAGVSNAIGKVGEASSLLQTVWGNVKNGISAAEGRLGKGPMGRTFAEGYNPGAESLTTALAGAPAATGRVANAGSDCMTAYIEADARGKQGLSDAFIPPQPPA